MKHFIAAILVLVLGFGFLAPVAQAGYVSGHYRSNGTYVKGYYRSDPDRSPYNNYGYPGNYNPNTRSISGGSQRSYLKSYYKSSYRSTSRYSY